MNSFLAEAARLLRRSKTPPVIAAVNGKPQPEPEPAKLPVLADQATLGELESLLSSLHEERNRALNLINSQEDRRAELLMQEGTDDAILSLTREADIARLTIERIEVLESEARYQHGLRKAEQDRATWITMRDWYATTARAYYDAMIRVEQLRGDVDGARQRLLRVFGTAEQHIPLLPYFATNVMAYGAGGGGMIPTNSTAFDTSMAAFANLLFEPAGTPQPGRGQHGMVTPQAEFEAVISGHADRVSASTWGGAVEFDAAREVIVGFKMRRRLADGRTVQAGDKARMTAGDARALIAAGTGAFLLDGNPPPASALGELVRAAALDQAKEAAE